MIAGVGRCGGSIPWALQVLAQPACGVSVLEIPMVSPGSFAGSLWALQGTQLLSWAPEQLRLNSDLGQSRGVPGLAWGVSSQPSCACSPGGSGGGEGCRASTLQSLVPEAFRAPYSSLGFTGTLLLDTDTQILLSWHGEAQTARGWRSRKVMER